MDISFLAEIHSKVVHFPIALLVVYSILEIAGIVFNKEFVSKSALLVLCIGVVTAFLAVLSGHQASIDFKFWNEASSKLLDEHRSSATYLLWGSVLISALRIFIVVKKKFVGLVKLIFIPLAILILLVVYETGVRGGNLVKVFGVGTELHKYLNEE